MFYVFLSVLRVFQERVEFERVEFESSSSRVWEAHSQLWRSPEGQWRDTPPAASHRGCLASELRRWLLWSSNASRDLTNNPRHLLLSVPLRSRARRVVLLFPGSKRPIQGGARGLQKLDYKGSGVRAFPFFIFFRELELDELELDELELDVLELELLKKQQKQNKKTHNKQRGH